MKYKFPGILLGYLSFGAVFTYLAWDEPLRYPATLEDLYPVRPGDAESYAVLVRYASGHPYQKEVDRSYFVLRVSERATVTERTTYLDQHRAEILAAWEKLASARAWLAELNGFELIGDSRTASYSSPSLDFSLSRQLVSLHIAHAQLLAREGKGDEAVSVILPVLEVTRKMFPSARGGYHSYLINNFQKVICQALPYLLDHSQPSAEAKTRLAAELRSAQRGTEGVRNLYLGDLPFISHSLPTKSDADSSYDLRKLLSPLYCNPNQTINQIGDLYTVLEQQAARRDFTAMDASAEAQASHNKGLVFKNTYGLMIADMVVPSSRLVKNYWDNEDLRAALIARLEKP